jgi:hypothetical protein
MKKTFVLLLVLAVAVIVSSCVSIRSAAQGLPHRDAHFKIESAEKPKSISPSFWVHVSFEGREYLVAQEKKRAEVEIREPDLEALPATGIIHIQINGLRYPLAKGENCVYIVRDSSGAVIVREQGTTHTVINAGSSQSDRWYSYDSLLLDTPLSFPLRVRVVSTIVPEEFWEFTINEVEE